MSVIGSITRSPPIIPVYTKYRKAMKNNFQKTKERFIIKLFEKKVELDPLAADVLF